MTGRQRASRASPVAGRATAPVDGRTAALTLFQAVLHQQSTLEAALDALPGPDRLAGRDRALAHRLAATGLRRLGQADALIGGCLASPLPNSAAGVHDMLRLATVELLFLGTPAHAAVDQWVGHAGRVAKGRYRGLANAVLRRLVREGAAMLATQDAAELNTPAWLREAWTESFGETTWRAIAEAHLAEPPLDLTPRTGGGDLADRLGATVLPTGTLRLAGGGPVTALAGFDAGEWWVQDAAASLPVRLLGAVAGQTVLDLCAAPGGKTAQLVAAGARAVAVDRSRPRLARLEANLRRLGLVAETVLADVAEWRPPTPAGLVLLDAPCTATGTIRRHPDIPWLKGPDDEARMRVVQDRLLAAAVDMLAPDGRLVYCVCSLQAGEGAARIEALLASGAPVVRDPLTADELPGAGEFIDAAGDLRTLPCQWPEHGGLDGFYAARLRRGA